jgi:hypothetical protein
MTATAASARGRSNRNRGARAEVQVVNHLIEHGFPSARRVLAGDGRQPYDVVWHPLIALDVKDWAKPSWGVWCRQAAAAAPPGTVPVVVRRTRGNPDVGMWECRVEEESWVWWASERPPGTCADPLWVIGSLHWCSLPFADLIAAVRQLDEVDR